MESRRRSIAKTVTWRVIATTITVLVSYIWLEEWATSIALAITANGMKALLYYLHERSWNRIDFGRRKETKEDYVI